jgi:hypothetical protein
VNAVPFGTINPGSDYNCQFDGQFCGTLDQDGCMSQDDKVTPSLAGDDNPPETVSNSSNTLTAKVCITATGTSAP